MATKTAPRDTDAFQVRALTRGLSILCLFDVDHREWTIDEMAEQTGLVRMTVYRMARTLESMAFLVRNTSTNRYSLGPATIAMRYVSDDQSGFVSAARPFLEALVRETGESVTLAVEVDGYPVCVDILNTTRPFKRRTAPGRILGDVGTVHGKIFSAFKSPEGRQVILGKPLLPRTSDTTPDRESVVASRSSGARPVRRRGRSSLGGHAGRSFRTGRKSLVHPSGQEGRHVVLSLLGLDSWKVRHLVVVEATIDCDYVQR
jgi:DNA-binding IclR family transcriptional regulator